MTAQERDAVVAGTSIENGPQVLIWLLTNRCQLACAHCYAARFEGQRELSPDQALSVLHEAAGAGVRHMGLAGGEPLLRPDTLDLIAEATRLGMTTGLVTNGSLVTRPVAERFAESGATVYISVDGACPQTHERVRGPGTWRFVERAVRDLGEAGVAFRTVMAVSRLNHEEVSGYLALARELGAAQACLIPVMPSGRAGADLVLGPEEMARVLGEADSVAEALGLTVNLWCTPFAPAVVASKRLSSGNCRGAPELNLAPNGDVLLCDILDDVLANVVEDGVVGAFQRQEAHPAVRRLWQNVPDEPCASCPALASCGGGCYARAQLLGGDLFGPDPLCPRVAAARASRAR